MGTKTKATTQAVEQAVEEYVADGAHVWLHPQLVKYAIPVEPELLEQLKTASAAWLGVRDAYEAAVRDHEDAGRQSAAEVPAGDFSAVRERAKRGAEAVALAEHLQAALAPAAKALGAATLRYLGAMYRTVLAEGQELKQELRGMHGRLSQYHTRMGNVGAHGDQNGRARARAKEILAEYGDEAKRGAEIDERLRELDSRRQMIQIIAHPFAMPGSASDLQANQRIPEILQGRGVEQAAAAYGPRRAGQVIDRVTKNRATTFTKGHHQRSVAGSAGTPLTRPSTFVPAE